MSKKDKEDYPKKRKRTKKSFEEELDLPEEFIEDLNLEKMSIEEFDEILSHIKDEEIRDTEDTEDAEDMCDSNSNVSLALYDVIILNDDHNTFAHATKVISTLFHHPTEKAIELAQEIDRNNGAIVDTTNFERAELKMELVKANGMTAIIMLVK